MSLGADTWNEKQGKGSIENKRKRVWGKLEMESWSPERRVGNMLALNEIFKQKDWTQDLLQSSSERSWESLLKGCICYENHLPAMAPVSFAKKINSLVKLLLTYSVRYNNRLGEKCIFGTFWLNLLENELLQLPKWANFSARRVARGSQSVCRAVKKGEKFRSLNLYFITWLPLRQTSHSL